MKLRLKLLGLPLLWAITQPAFAQSGETLLLRTPAISDTHLAFAYAGDIWLCTKDGKEPRRLTVHPGVETEPSFSPDGQLIAFSGNYEGNTDVYVVPVEGGVPRRLTYHPASDQIKGWTPDGQQIVFSSNRYSYSSRFNQLYTVSVKGGFPEALPMPMAEHGKFSADGKTIAYTPVADAFTTWKRYRGGQTSPIWLFDVQTYDVTEIPHQNASDTRPVWAGSAVYFLSDRNGTMNVFMYDPATKVVKQITQHKNFDVKSLNSNGKELVYEQAGRIHRLDPTSGQSRPLPVYIAPDLLSLRPQFKKADKYIHNAGISPTGMRALFEVRGDIFTVPLEKGDARNLTQTPGSHERSPAWSPDGKSIAYFSDADGEYQLLIRDQLGAEKPKTINLGEATFYYAPQWSPDSKKILYTNKKMQLFFLDVASRKYTLIDADTYDHPERTLKPVWSPDSKYIAYTKRLDNHLRAVFIYDIAAARTQRVTDGMSDAISATFSRDGKYLYFAASTNFGLNSGWLDMSSYERPVKRSLYVTVLDKTEPSPFAPESDEEEVKLAESEIRTGKEKAAKPDNAKKTSAAKEEITVKIDFDGIDQRILALPLPEGNYSDLQTAADGKLFYRESFNEPNKPVLHCFEMKKRESEEFMPDIFDYQVSADGKKLLYESENNAYGIVSTGNRPKAGEGKLDLGKMEVYVDPRAEWKQMFDEVWRIERDYFYVANMHGADWPAVKKQYEPFLAHVGHRSDLNYLFAELMGEMVVGHNYVGGGDLPSSDGAPVGLLGADYSLENGYYRFKKIYSGLNWNPDLRAPLTEPGINVKEGEYLLAVNGKPLTAADNIYSLFLNTAEKQTILTVNSRPTEAGARKITVVPIKNESSLRNRAWVENNRKKVDEQTNGQVAYVYLPNTAGAGYTYFNRYYFSQLDKKATIIDERFNGGGSAADYIIDNLDRPLLSHWATREGKMFATPTASIFGPKVMIVNEYAGSGGDALPLYFRRRNLGKLVGKRTWGGLVGIYDYPVLMDGGYVTAPRMGIVSPDGQWEVENEGVAPDIEVIMTPKQVIEGKDPQLEKAIEVVMQELKSQPVKTVNRPADPNRAGTSGAERPENKSSKE